MIFNMTVARFLFKVSFDINSNYFFAEYPYETRFDAICSMTEITVQDDDEDD